MQGLYNYNTQEAAHDLSYRCLQLGLKYKTAGFGLTANLSCIEPFEVLKENYAFFLRKEFY